METLLLEYENNYHPKYINGNISKTHIKEILLSELQPAFITLTLLHYRIEFLCIIEEPSIRMALL